MHINIFSIFAIVIVLSLVVNGDSEKPSNELEEKVSILLTKWREGPVQTNLFQLPSIKIIDVEGIDGFYNDNGIKITFSIAKMQLTGLDTFSLEEITVKQNKDSMTLTAQIRVPILTLHSDKYSLKGSAYYFYPIKGSGGMTIQLKDVVALSTVRFVRVDDFSSKIDKFSLQYNINKVKANLEKSTFLINQVLNAEGAAILNGFHDDIVNGTWNYAVPQANEYLSNVSLSDFVKTILNVSQSAIVIKNTK